MPQASISPQLRAAVWKRDDGICGICGEAADPLEWNADHIVPKVLFGPTVIHNLRVTHPRCNRRRTAPHRMTVEQINDAADEWTANQVGAAEPDFAEFVAAHQENPAITNGEWTCRCPLCERWRAAVSA